MSPRRGDSMKQITNDSRSCLLVQGAANTCVSSTGVPKVMGRDGENGRWLHRCIWIDVMDSQGKVLFLRKIFLAVLNYGTKEISGANLEPLRNSGVKDLTSRYLLKLLPQPGKDVVGLRNSTLDHSC